MTSPAPFAECERGNDQPARDDYCDAPVLRTYIQLMLARPDGFVRVSLNVDCSVSKRTWPLSPHLPGIELDVSSDFDGTGAVLTLFAVRRLCRFRQGHDVELTTDAPVACMVVESEEGDFTTLSASLHGSG